MGGMRMASLISNSPEAAPEGRQLIDTWADGHSAWLDLLAVTQQGLWLMDHDLSGWHRDTGDAPDRLLACLRRLHPGQVRCLIRDSAAVLQRMPRTRQVLIDFGHVVSVRIVAPHHEDALDQSVVIVDRRHTLVRPRYDIPRAWLRREDPADAARLLPQLETIWSAAADANMGAPLGL